MVADEPGNRPGDQGQGEDQLGGRQLDGGLPDAALR